MSSCSIVDLGMIGYAEAYALQKRMVVARKAEAIGDVLLLCEHPPVITQGRNGKSEHLLVSQPLLRQRNVEFFETSRGGDVTFHGPGQLVGYPILNLGAIRRDVVWYVRMLEEVMIRTTAEFGIRAEREAGKTGVWAATKKVAEGLPTSEGSQGEKGVSAAAPEKLGAIGVHISRWVASHGFAYNVSTDLRYFDLIVPCGIVGRKATSLEKLLERAVSIGQVAALTARHFGSVFGLTIEAGTKQALLESLEHAEQLVAAAVS
ncbi:MAG TPA: lipoyl(octanoyl) transferase LipB [Candidatus Methylomirabilis sp.]|nr:lipoyl(octanoyl) transferase LipB [Candidatus Methylomirabilis sp.]